MPGRNGYAVSGGWANSAMKVNNQTFPADLTIDTRDASLSEYLAGSSITLQNEFEDKGADEYIIHIATGSTIPASPSNGTGTINGTGNGNYRYGFNGKEKDGDMDGNNYDYGFRIYNPGLGRFLSVDPLTKKYPELTPYQFASNTPIQAIDLDGKEKFAVTGENSTGNTKTLPPALKAKNNLDVEAGRKGDRATKRPIKEKVEVNHPTETPNTDHPTPNLSPKSTLLPPAPYDDKPTFTDYANATIGIGCGVIEVAGGCVTAEGGGFLAIPDGGARIMGYTTQLGTLIVTNSKKQASVVPTNAGAMVGQAIDSHPDNPTNIGPAQAGLGLANDVASFAIPGPKSGIIGVANTALNSWQSPIPYWNIINDFNTIPNK